MVEWKMGLITITRWNNFYFHAHVWKTSVLKIYTNEYNFENRYKNWHTSRTVKLSDSFPLKQTPVPNFPTPFTATKKMALSQEIAEGMQQEEVDKWF